MGPTGFLTKGISFSPFMRKVWPEMGDLKPLNGTNPPNPPFCFVLRHPAPLLSHPILQHNVYIPLPCFSPPFTRTLELNFHTARITANTNKTATCLVFLPYLGSRKLPKAKSYRATHSSRKPRIFETPGFIPLFSSDPFPLVFTTIKCRISHSTRRPCPATSNLR